MEKLIKLEKKTSENQWYWMLLIVHFLGWILVGLPNMMGFAGWIGLLLTSITTFHLLYKYKEDLKKANGGE